MAAARSHQTNESAWMSLFGNVVVWPGIGTLFLRRWLLGVAQCLVALFGLLLLATGTTYGALALLAAFVWAVASSLDAFESQER